MYSYCQNLHSRSVIKQVRLLRRHVVRRTPPPARSPRLDAINFIIISAIRLIIAHQDVYT